MRRGWSLHEMIMSLGITGLVALVAVRVANVQLRFFSAASSVTAMQTQLSGAAGIVTGLLWPLSPAAGDVVAAMDSAIEFGAAIGTAVVCGSAPGRIEIPVPSARGNVLGAYVESPEPDDRATAFFADTVGGTWLGVTVASAPVRAGTCALFPSAAAWSVDLREPIVVPTGSVVRFLRPMRLSLYRASDGSWYLGAKDWNDAAQRFNTIQPVAGPLRPYSVDAASTGLLFEYLDRNGEAVDDTQLSRIASIRVTARSATEGPVFVSGRLRTRTDTLALRVVLRNAP